MDSAAFLRNVPVLADLPEELLREVVGKVRTVRVRAGDWIMREGDAADAMFIVKGGRVEVVDEGPPSVVIRVLSRGDVLGELALLREGNRSVSARARRDAELLELRRQEFEMLIQEAPSFALGLTRAMGAQLAASRTPLTAAAVPHTIAVIGLDVAAPVAAVAEGLTEALSNHGSVALISEGTLSTIDQAERDVGRVVLRCMAPGESWTRLCIAEADVIVAVSAGAHLTPGQNDTAALMGCELLVLGTGVDGSMIEALRPREVQVIADQGHRRAALEATARRLVGRSLGIVLSGGGARALAHLGVLEELTAAGVHFDRIGGVSLGSIVAAAAASGLAPDATYQMSKSFLVDSNPTRDFVPPIYSLIRGGRTRQGLYEVFGDRRIEELPLRLFCLSCDLVARETVVHRYGPLIEAVYASLSIPGVFPPMATDTGRVLVDGGVLDNLPVATMARTGEGPVIAVDVTGRKAVDVPGLKEQVRQPRRPGLRRFSRPVRRALTGSDSEIPPLGETMVRALTVGSIDTVAAASIHADLVITPKVEGIALLDWKALPRMRELGREAVRQALADNPELTRSLVV